MSRCDHRDGSVVEIRATAPDRPEGDEGNVIRDTSIQDGRIIPLGDVEVVLDRGDARDGAGVSKMVGVDVTEPEMADESLLAQRGERRKAFAERLAVWRRHRADAQVHEIETLQPQRLAAMMKEYVTTAQIVAPPESVWAILANGAAYAEWNPEIVAIDGAMARGASITAHVRLGDGAIRRVTQRVGVFEPPHRMEWIGGLPFGLFVGRRVFTVTAVAGGTEFRMHLYMSGPLSTMILKSVGDRQPEIDSFSAGLKRRADQRT